MKVFVAAESFGEEGDFSHAIPGELVHLSPDICASPDCGCDRSMAGFVSHRGTTSFVVRDLDLDPATYAGLLFDTLAAGGWVDNGSSSDREWTDRWAEEHLELAADFPAEAPLRVDRDLVSVRSTD